MLHSFDREESETMLEFVYVGFRRDFNTLRDSPKIPILEDKVGCEGSYGTELDV